MHPWLVADEPDFVVVNKPAGLSFHSEQGPGLVALLAAELGYPLWAVHRLDKITSGLLLLAKRSSAAAELSQSFAERRVEKYYLALASGKPKKKQGLIRGDMAKARGGSYRLLPSHQQPAVTQFHSFSLVPGLRLYVLRPHTGKTHQLRVALKSLGCPILGDDRYGGPLADRGYLHAWQLALSYQGRAYRWQQPPTSGEHFLSPPLQQWLAEHAAPERLPWPLLP